MTRVKLCVKQIWNHRHREQTDGCKEEEVKGGVDWEAGVSRYKILHTEWISNKNLHYSTENYIQYLMIKQQKRIFRKRMYMWMCVHVLSHFSSTWLFETLWTIACQAPLSREFSRQECWSGLPCPPPGDLPDPGIELMPPVSPAFQMHSLPLSHQGRLLIYVYVCITVCIAVINTAL